MSSPGVRGPWSDGETSALIQAWGPMYVACSGGSLHGEEWRQVCSAVNAHRTAAGLRFNRSRLQCQRRVYTIKDQYQKELAKGQPTSGWRHFAQLRAFLADPDIGPPPGFPAKMPLTSVKGVASGGSSGSVRRRTVPAKRHVSSLQDILDRSGDPTKMPATTAAKEEKVGREGPASVGCNPAAVVTKLAEVYERVEMERLSVEKEEMAKEREKRAAKVEADNLGETHD